MGLRPCLFAALREWWDVSARDLPWRFGRTTPWGVLLSEVMSQQTPMSRVAPYWIEWMRMWPDPEALAAAPVADVITAWGRLGYPRRAIRLRECAARICERFGGAVPDDYDDLLSLPGIGDYTASAVVSFAYGRRVAVKDTNIRRVLSRVVDGVESVGGSATARDRELAEVMLPDDPDDSVVWNQAVMELGAVVCTARTPNCADCPVSSSCAFLAAGRPGLGERRTRPRQRFQGTDRQVRGLILNALRGMAKNAGRSGDGESMPRSVVRSLWGDSAQVDACVASLDEDGLIEILEDGAIRLPRE
ncbi:A/G-specific adenine glycosylase [uncultured Bifidobacterium sp.]|uniref:A/G-specific adenine glycosylase n=1 Tax=uncultured Bifidobacterium sp. TaxID=165187 RepID=UPI002626DE8E|nr:A/G-specific adenine glycosylase [uncultured Bifidobacterium sp.]